MRFIVLDDKQTKNILPIFHFKNVLTKTNTHINIKILESMYHPMNIWIQIYAHPMYSIVLNLCSIVNIENPEQYEYMIRFCSMI